LGNVGCSPVKEAKAIIIFRQSTPEIPTKAQTVVLSLGDSVVVEVWAKSPANHTNIQVQKGSKYRFVVPPGQIWTDWFVGTDANGYSHGPLPFIQEAFRSRKLLPDSNWFVLTGAIDRPENAPFAIGGNPAGTPIGTPVQREMTSSGELILFANDAKSFYWNNFGRIQVIVTRVP
jgi:hypothetical protein